MSIVNTRECVKSKYFVDKTAMEESLSDFQETKPNCKGPKATQKVIKVKARKVIKHLKGQKDIRTVLKGKQSDLISYTKEFNNVCKKSGLDVDSEQLQVAIALSKSLQTETLDGATTSQTLTSQGRVAKIRKTLQEYGFKVPETKVTSSKGVKKQRKHYKLLNTTEEERHHKIQKKYSEVLFASSDCELSVIPSHKSNTPIYDIATNLEYEFMKDNNVYYVDILTNLVERSTTTGSLLRNWSEIPGRPVSPVLSIKNAMDISEIKCSQDELDIILSGPIKSAYKISTNNQIRHYKNIDETNNIVIESRENKVIDSCIKKGNIHGNSITINEEVHILKKTIETSPVEITCDAKCKVDIESNNIHTAKEQYRSYSPDIFDDEMISINEISKPVLSQDEKTKVFTEDTNCMDLTECVCVDNIKFKLATFNSINVTKRLSNDLMEMTECASQGIQQNIKEIDLMQSHADKPVINVDSDLNSAMVNPKCALSQRRVNEKCKILHKNYDNMDPSQSSESSNMSIHDKNMAIYTEFINTNLDISVDDNKIVAKAPSDDIDLTQSSNEDENRLIATQANTKVSNKKTESIDLTQSSKSSVDIGDLPEINVDNTQNNQTNLDDTIILNEDEYLCANGKVKNPALTQNHELFDLTQTEDTSLEEPNNLLEEGTLKPIYQSFYEDFIHDHLDSKDNVDSNQNPNDTSRKSDDIDLTQTSNESTENAFSRPITVNQSMLSSSSLGKRYDISIDYDEVCEVNDKDSVIKSNCAHTNNNSLHLFNAESTKSVPDDVAIIDEDNDLSISNCSQNSEVFDLTDKELNYSLHRSRLDLPMTNYNYDFGEISAIDDNGASTKEARYNFGTDENFTTEESFLPVISMKSKETECETTTLNSTHKPMHNIIKNSALTSIGTPETSDYIIKTEEITPMLDYASLTTPQRNKELDKYGLRPFKRKRAIQILTHLYNQTHPIVEPLYDDEQASSSKKVRHDLNEPIQTLPLNTKSRKTEKVNINLKSPRKGKRNSSKSPRQVTTNIKSPSKEGNSSEALYGNSSEVIYEVTSDVPNIKCVDCNPNDWAFQKREKAKVHSCRLPLHIAFHNYVSSRRGLREAILKYEPVNIDVIHKDLVSYGHRYDPKDLLKFLDKKCITVKTTDNNSRNKR